MPLPSLRQTYNHRGHRIQLTQTGTNYTQSDRLSPFNTTAVVCAQLRENQQKMGSQQKGPRVQKHTTPILSQTPGSTVTPTQRTPVLRHQHSCVPAAAAAAEAAVTRHQSFKLSSSSQQVQFNCIPVTQQLQRQACHNVTSLLEQKQHSPAPSTLYNTWSTSTLPSQTKACSPGQRQDGGTT